MFFVVNFSCQWWTRPASVMDKCIFFYEGCNRKPKTTFGLKNTGKHWQLVFVCPPIYEIIGFWLVLQKYFFNQLFFWRGRYMNSITDAAIINQFLKLLFCNRSWSLGKTQSKYIITWQQCLKSPEMHILCEAGQNDLLWTPSFIQVSFWCQGSFALLWCLLQY